MPAPEWALTVVESKLLEGADEGSTYTIDVLQEACGIGHDDLMATLDALRENGKAEEVSPGEWATAAYVAEAPQTRAALAHEDEEAEDREHSTAVRPADVTPADGVVETVITAGMAKQLEAANIGALVMAGLADASGRPFILRIEP